MSKGIKNDAGKPDLSLIPKVAMDRMAEAFMVGARKYDRYNFAKGMEASRVLAALLRHATAWNEGEETDPTDGQHHLGSVLACAAMLLRMQELGTLIDDRYKPEEPKFVKVEGPYDEQHEDWDQVRRYLKNLQDLYSHGISKL